MSIYRKGRDLIELDDLRRYTLYEAAVVVNKEQRRLLFQDHGLDLLAGHQVDVVERLIPEQSHIGISGAQGGIMEDLTNNRRNVRFPLVIRGKLGILGNIEKT